MRTVCTKARLILRSGMLLPALLAITAIPTMATAATVFTVGPDSNCDYSSTRRALEAVAALTDASVKEIRISWTSDRSLGYTWLVPNTAAIFSPQSNLVLRGGFASCSATAPASGQFTRLIYNNVDTDSYYPMLSLSNSTANNKRYFDLHDIRMEGASGSNTHGPNGGGGIKLTGNVQVRMYDSRVSGFHATNGGGVYLLGSGTDATRFPGLNLGIGSYVNDNTASNSGGGIYSFLGRVTMSGATVSNNSADKNGGGIALYDYADTGDVFDDSHLALLLKENSSDPNTISGNSAGTASFSNTIGLGGGIYSHYGQIRFKGSPGNPVFHSQVFANSANLGGAIYIEGPDEDAGGPFTEMILNETMFYANSARGQGGALYLRNAVAGQIFGYGGECQVGFGSPHPSPCIYFGANQAMGTDGEGDIPRGGAIYLHHTRTDDASRPGLNVFRAWFDDNSDPNGLAAVAAMDGRSDISFSRSIFTNNDAKNSDAAASALIYTHTARGLNFKYNTVLDSNTSTRMFNISGGTLDVTGSILWGTVDRFQPFHFVWFDLGAANMVHNNCILVRESDGGTAGIPFPDSLWSGYTPQLDRRFAPSGNSAAIDHCAAGDPSVDAYLQPVFNVPGVPQRYGNSDLGAVEQTDVLFANSFGVRPTN